MPVDAKGRAQRFRPGLPSAQAELHQPSAPDRRPGIGVSRGSPDKRPLLTLLHQPSRWSLPRLRHRLHAAWLTIALIRRAGQGLGQAQRPPQPTHFGRANHWAQRTEIEKRPPRAASASGANGRRRGPATASRSSDWPPVQLQAELLDWPRSARRRLLKAGPRKDRANRRHSSTSSFLMSARPLRRSHRGPQPTTSTWQRSLPSAGSKRKGWRLRASRNAGRLRSAIWAGEPEGCLLWFRAGVNHQLVGNAESARQAPNTLRCR